MKKVVYLFFSILITANLNAQVNDCVKPVAAFEMNESIPIEFIPTDFTDDIWAAPILDDDPVEDRMIVWVHGLGGKGDPEPTSSNSWIQASSQTDIDYYSSSRRPEYTNVDLEAAGYYLKGLMEDYDETDDRTIMIAHSQGGIVARELEKIISNYDYEKTFGGLVTFGSPHQGAMILNNINEFQPWLESACDDLSAGPLAEFEATTFLGGALSLFVDLEDISNYICVDALPRLMPFFTGQFEAPITSDYQVGASELGELNEHTPEIPIVCFYGRETEPYMWNTLVHIIPGHLPNDAAPFMANNDESLKEDVDEAILQYWTKYLEWDEEADYWGSFFDGDDDSWFEVLPIILTGGLYYIFESAYEFDEAVHVRNEWKKGYDWWAMANPTWKSIIGADNYVIDSYTCQCIDEFKFDLIDDYYTIEPGEECDPDWGDCLMHVNYVLETFPNDGVVLCLSSGHVLGFTHAAVMDGSNHFSMRNDYNTGVRLTELFNGDYGDFFQIDPK